MIRIACIGDNCIDYYDETDERYPGGNPVNVSVYLQRLGTHASYIGAVGNDENGSFLLSLMKEKNVDLSHVKVLEGNTAVTHVVRINGERVFKDDDPGVNSKLTLTDEDIDFISEHNIVVTGLWGYTEGFFPVFKERKIPIAYDASDKLLMPQCAEGMRYADYFFFSDDVSGEDKLVEQMQEIAVLGPKVVVAMRGSLGSLAFSGGKVERCGIVNCEVADTMGAGDSYIAGFLNEFLKDADLSESMKKGAQNAAITIGYAGAW